ncbi:MAG: SDR family oxidoreductase [Deltaproteobacteria bacterium]|nr:SDR family oxidoreductase [Deltaproteobacteria bacterium]MBW2421095.1 SDR family oxidoreductase [Deltaproteobacteria bacterium]
MGRLDGKVGMVTAGATGIGLGCAQAIVSEGGKVMICARREEVLKEAAEQLGPNADWVACDVTDDASVDAAVSATVERLGPLSLAVNSAGMGMASPILELPTDQFESNIDTNLTGTFRCIRAQARAMKEAGGGSIVNISSIAGALTHPWMSAYCVSKAGVNMLTQCAADELGELDIRVNAVMPGVVHTPMASMLADNEVSREEYLRLMPISRIGNPEDVGAMVGFLLSDEASWITGQIIGVDGGHTIRKGPNLVPLFKQFMGA